MIRHELCIALDSRVGEKQMGCLEAHGLDLAWLTGLAP